MPRTFLLFGFLVFWLQSQKAGASGATPRSRAFWLFGFEPKCQAAKPKSPTPSFFASNLKTEKPKSQNASGLAACTYHFFYNSSDLRYASTATISVGLFCHIIGLFFHMDRSLLKNTHTSGVPADQQAAFAM